MLLLMQIQKVVFPHAALGNLLLRSFQLLSAVREVTLCSVQNVRLLELLRWCRQCHRNLRRNQAVLLSKNVFRLKPEMYTIMLRLRGHNNRQCVSLLWHLRNC